jgi:hypothetical protein
METIQNQSFQTLPSELAVKLRQLILEFSIESIYFHPATSTSPPHLVFFVVDYKHCDQIETRKWLCRAQKKQQLFFHVLNKLQMIDGYKEGNPFIPTYCTSATKVYQDNENIFQPKTNWKAFKKRFKKYEYEYNQENEFLMNMVNDFFVVKARTSIFLTYISLYEQHLTYLERLYIGHSFNGNSLTERIKFLSQYLPSIEDLFVKQNGSTYYLIAQLEVAIQAAEDGDEMMLNWNLYPAIKEVEEQLYTMVSDRFLALKKRIKCNKPSTDKPIAVAEKSPMDQQLFEVVAQINKIKQPEEIYLFHTTQMATTTFYYILLIGAGIGTAILNRMQQSVTAKATTACNVILIGHTRFWIQDNLFIHQEFFKKIMTLENRIFKIPYKQFTMHWEKCRNPYYGDLDSMYKATDKMIAQYFVLREHAALDNAEGLNTMFATAILRAFRTLIYSKLSYQPHYLSAYNLWMICCYAKPNLGKMEYLFVKLGGDAFFKNLDYSTKFNHGLDRIPEEKWAIMDEILNVLKNELTPAVEKVGGMGND